MAEFLANCLHGLEALGPDGLWVVMGALFVAGLAGGATHCCLSPLKLSHYCCAIGEGLDGSEAIFG